MSGPKDASINADGFRFYRWDDGVNEPTDVLSVTSIRKLCGLPFTLVNWQLANVVDVAMGTMKRPAIGKKGQVLKGKFTNVPVEWPSEFAKRLAATDGKQAPLNDLRRWLRDQADEPRNIAARRGTIVHSAIEHNIAWERVERPWVESEFDQLSRRDRERAAGGVQDEDIDFIRASVRQYWDMRSKVPFVIIAREPQVWNLCHPVGTRVLTHDLRWVEAEQLSVGDKLWAFTEEAPGGRGQPRQWQAGEVTATRISAAATVKVTFASGRTMVSTLPHPYLATRPGKRARTAQWIEAKDLRPGDVLPRYFEPWSDDTSYEGGWLAGMYDGEGCLVADPKTQTYNLTLSQKEGAVLDRARGALAERGFTWSETAQTGVIGLSLRGGIAEIVRALGSLRPIRLLPKFGGGNRLQAQAYDRVVSVEPNGIEAIVNLTTSTKTYFAEGYGSHNTAGYAGSGDALVWVLPEDVDLKRIPKAHEITAELIEEIGGYTVLVDWKTSKGVYCRTRDSLILTDDLRWVRADSLAVGDGLWAFTENRVNGGRGGRRWVRSEVTATGIVCSDTVRVTMASGRVLDSTPNHPYLARRTSGGRRMTEGGTAWVEAQNLRPGDTLPFYMEPWMTEESREAGWLAGMFDGEGCLSAATGRNRYRLSIAQKEGPVAERIRQAFRALDIQWAERPNGAGNVVDFHVLGGVRKVASVLGRLRPTRLLPKFEGGTDLQSASHERDVVVSVELAGEQEVVNLTTSSATYFSDGYGSHNTDHVVQVHAYLGSEFVGANGIRDERLTEILRKTMKGGLVHIRPDGWEISYVDFREDVMYAFLGSCAFARFLGRYPDPRELFTHQVSGNAGKESE